MRLRVTIAGLLALAAGCGDDDSAGTGAPELARPAPEQAAAATARPWRISAQIKPREIDVLEMRVSSLTVDPEYKPVGHAPFLQGRMAFRNTGDEPIDVEPIDYSAFSEDQIRGDQLLLAEGQCGFGIRRPGGPVEPGTCTLALLPPTPIAPGATKHRSFAVFRGLSGMDRLEPGTYSFTRPVRFSRPSGDEERSTREEATTIVFDARHAHGHG